MGHVSADRAHVRIFQFEFWRDRSALKSERAVHRKFVGADFLELRLLGIEFVLNVADQFFEARPRASPFHTAAEFVDHDGEVARVYSEKSQ